MLNLPSQHKTPKEMWTYNYIKLKNIFKTLKIEGCYSGS